MNRFVKGNSNTCIGCRTCMVGCVVSHEGIEFFRKPPGQTVFNPRLDVVKTRTISIAVQCKHCENAACLNACVTKAITKVDGAMIINPDRCLGCKTCVLACPYGAVTMAKAGDGRLIANKCDLCAGKAEQECVKVCLTNSLKLVTEEGMSESVGEKRLKSAVALSQDAN